MGIISFSKMKLYGQNPINSYISCIRVVDRLCGQNVSYVQVTDEFKKSDEYKKMTTTDKFPLLQTDEGCMHETTAICKYLCAVHGKYLGNNAVQRSQVDQWISFNNGNLTGAAMNVYNGVFGWDELSVADIIIANCLQYGFQTVLDQGFMKSIKNVNEWAASVFALPEYVHIFGKVKMCEKPLRPVLAEVAKKVEKKKAAP